MVSKNKLPSALINRGQSAIFVVLVVSVFLSLVPVAALGVTKEESMRKKADANIKIAAEYIKRSMYKDAELMLTRTDDEYGMYLTEGDKQKISDLLGEVATALSERQRILDMLNASDEFAANHRYLEAKAKLEVIKDSEYITPQMRKQVLANIADLDVKIDDHRKQMRRVFNDSVKLFYDGQLEDARNGFKEVSLSNTDSALISGTALEMTAGSENMTVIERGQIVAGIREMDKKFKSVSSRVHKLFDVAVKLYDGGQLDQAKAIFVEVEDSGVEVVLNGYTASDYLSMINEAQMPVAPGVVPEMFEPVGAGPSTADIEDELLDGILNGFVPEDVEVFVPAEPAEAVVEIVPEEVEVFVPAEPVEAVVEIVPEEVEVFVPVEPVEVEVEIIAVEEPAVEEEVVPKPAGTGYIGEIERRNAILRQRTGAIVADSVRKAEAALAINEFGQSKQELARGFSTISKSRLLLGDELYTRYFSQLTILDEQVTSRKQQFTQAQDEQKRIDAKNLQEKIRATAADRRIKAINDYMERARSFLLEKRYEEALGQLEQILAIEPTNNQAQVLKATLKDTIRWREQLRIEKKSDQEELGLLLESMKAGVPYQDEMNYPDDWQELTRRRKEDAMAGRSPEDVVVYKQLDQIVDLSMFNPDMALVDAIDILVNSSDPPLTVVVLWGDLDENAFIGQEEPIKMSGQSLSSVRLRTGFERLLQAVGGGLAELDFAIEDGIITIATKESLPTRYETRILNASELFGAPADFQGGMGMGGGGMSGGMGGGMSGGMGGMSGGMGGMSGGGMMGGGMSGGMGGMSGGMGGMSGGMGGMSGGGMGGGGMGGGMMGGSMMNRYRAYQVMDIIQETIEPDTWYDAGGEGTIREFSGNQLIVWQTPEVHEKVKDFLDEMIALIGQQVAIETRFLLVDENFLEDIGIDTNIARLNTGWNKINKESDDPGLLTFGSDAFESYEATEAKDTGISSTLASAASATLAVGNPAAAFLFSYGGPLDDLQVNFVVRATQMHANSKTLTAPKLVVLSGESGTISVMKNRPYVSGVSFSSDSGPVGDTVAPETIAVNYLEQEIDQLQTGIMMSVTPTITADKKYVILRIMTSLNDLLDAGLDNSLKYSVAGKPETVTWEEPVTENTSIQTRVLVPDQGTVLLGGLTLTAEKEIESGVPILSKIPILNRFFSNRSEVKDKQILLVLVKPTIILKDEAEEDAIAAMEQ